MDETGDDEFRRCSRNGSGGWRCKEQALPGKTHCERHHEYYRSRNSSSSVEKTGGIRNGVVVDDHDNGGKGLFGGDDHGVVEGFGGVFGDGEVNGGVKAGTGCESFNLWQQGDGQQGGRFEQGSGSLGQFLGDGVEFVGGFLEDRNRVADLGQQWGGVGVFGNGGGVSGVGKDDHGNGVDGVCGNDSLGFGSDGINGLISEGGGFGNLYDRSFQALLSQDRVCDEDVNLIGGGIGFQGLGGESAYDFRGVGNLSRYGKVEGEKNVGSILSVPESSNKMEAIGVEEGTEMLLSGGVSINEEARGEALKPLAKRGRPKGSKNKIKKKEVDLVINGETVCGSANVGTIVEILETEKSVFCGKADQEGVDMSDIARTKKRGQPEDLKRGRQIILAVGYEIDGVGEISGPMECGRKSKGSVNKEKNVEEVSSEVAGAGEIARPKKLGRLEGSKCGMEIVVEVSNDVGGEIARPKKRGRPKGSKCGKEIALEVNNEVVGAEVSSEVAGAGEIARPNKKLGRLEGSKCGKEIVVEVSNDVAGEIVRPKKRGRPKGSECGKEIVVEVNNEVASAGEIARPKKRGRPKGYKCQKEIVIKRGRPKGAKNKKKILEDQELPVQTLVQDEVQNVKPKLGRRPKGSKKNMEKKRRGRPKGSGLKPKEIAVQLDAKIERRGRPKGSGLKPKEIVVRLDAKIERRCRPKGSGKKPKEIVVRLDTKIERRGRPKGSGKKQKEAASRLALQIESQKSTLVDGALSTIMPHKHIQEESISPLEDPVNKEERSDFVLECSKDSGIEKITKGLMSNSGDVHKRCSERLRTLLTDHKNSQDVEVEENFCENEVEETIDHELESSDLMVSCA